MKIGIFTFHCAANYGAVLQAYALQEVLRGLGHEVYIIDYRPDYLIKPYSPFRYKFGNNDSLIIKLKGLIRTFLIAPIRWRRNRRFLHFINAHLNLYNLDLNDTTNNFDAFIFGSDQIWNPLITNGLDRVYLGNFPAAKGKKLIAYAASTGSLSNLKESDFILLRDSIWHFTSIGCRESFLQEKLEKYFNKKSYTVLDPVLLSGLSVFRHLVQEVKEEKPYLLLFQLVRNERAYRCANSFAKKKNLEVIEIVSFGNSLRIRKLKQTLSVGKFLGYIKNASFIITTSFHGTAFSLLFKKNFAYFSLNENQDSRISSLLGSLGLKDRMLSSVNTVYLPQIDYIFVDHQLQHYRDKSIAFLEQVLDFNNRIC